MLRYNSSKVYCKFSTYAEGKRLALAMFEEDDTMYGIVTVNIPDARLLNDNCQFIDTNNWGDKIVQWLIDNNFGKLTGYSASSGYCIYPEFEFDENIVKENALGTN